MTYRAAIEYLLQLQLFGAELGLSRVQRLADCAGNPQQQLRFIHVAGTNGKGSTCAILETIYRTSGLRTGLYTSPHLVSFRERLQVNRHLIDEDAVVRLVENARHWLEKFPVEEHPTFFEVVTAMALRHFAEQRCDLVLWETGLGGRLDATNIVTPLASVITNVQLDHEAWLGDTVEKIAVEKAGIIKPGIPIVTAAQEPALTVIREAAARQGAPLHVVTDARNDPAHAVSRGLSLRGEHQQLNAKLALKTVDVLQPVLPVAPDVIATALQHVEWPGRFQVIRRGNQTVVLDGAHNPAGAQALGIALRREVGDPPPPFTLVIGALADKKFPDVCRALAVLARRIIAVPVPSARTADARAIAQFCREASPEATVIAAESLRAALDQTRDDAWVVITGSLYLIGEAMVLLKDDSRHRVEQRLNEWRPR